MKINTLNICLLNVAMAAQLCAMDGNDTTLFDRRRCLTTQSVLQYAAELYVLKETLQLTEETQHMLLKDAWRAIENPANDDARPIYSGKSYEYIGQVAISKPAI